MEVENMKKSANRGIRESRIGESGDREIRESGKQVIRKQVIGESGDQGISQNVVII